MIRHGSCKPSSALHSRLYNFLVILMSPISRAKVESSYAVLVPDRKIKLFKQRRQLQPVAKFECA